MAKSCFGRSETLVLRRGIGGAGMSGIAEILHNLGYQISGSDQTPSEVTEYLVQASAYTINDAHAPPTCATSTCVVISSAVGEANPEVVEARRHGIPVIKRAEMLGELMRLKFSIGIAGTHGKTTTTSMIGHILRRPTSADADRRRYRRRTRHRRAARRGQTISSPRPTNTTARSSRCSPPWPVVLNVEPDHLDCYADIDDLRNAFLIYINRVPFYGSAIVSADDPNVAMLRSKFNRPYATFGFAAEADYRAIAIKMDPGRTTFSVYRRGDLLGELMLRVPAATMWPMPSLPPRPLRTRYPVCNNRRRFETLPASADASNLSVRPTASPSSMITPTIRPKSSRRCARPRRHQPSRHRHLPAAPVQPDTRLHERIRPKRSRWPMK